MGRPSRSSGVISLFKGRRLRPRLSVVRGRMQNFWSPGETASPSRTDFENTAIQSRAAKANHHDETNEKKTGRSLLRLSPFREHGRDHFFDHPSAARLLRIPCKGNPAKRETQKKGREEGQTHRA